jgi:hypothetical protein
MDQKNERGMSAIHLALECAPSFTLDVIKYLALAGAYMNDFTDEGSSALLMACQHEGFRELIPLFCAVGAHIGGRNAQGRCVVLDYCWEGIVDPVDGHVKDFDAEIWEKISLLEPYLSVSIETCTEYFERAQMLCRDGRPLLISLVESDKVSEQAKLRMARFLMKFFANPHPFINGRVVRAVRRSHGELQQVLKIYETKERNVFTRSWNSGDGKEDYDARTKRYCFSNYQRKKHKD